MSKTRKKRGKTGGKWARYRLKGVATQDVERKPHQRIKELERQLDDTRAFHTKKLRELNGKLQASARQQEKAQRKHSKDPKGPGAAPLRQKVKRLEGDLAKACDEIRRLQEEQHDTEDRLKEETTRVRELRSDLIRF